MEHFLPALLAASAMAAVHLFSPYLTFLDRTPRSIWLSLAGGISTAYVFLHLLPEVAHSNREVTSDEGEVALEPLFALALFGLVVFYGLERLAKVHAGRDGEKSPPGVFWLHIASFAVYNLIIGYILPQEAEDGPGGLAIYTFALGLHFVVNDRAYVAHHGPDYHDIARWILAGAVILGVVVSAFLHLPHAGIGAAIAFLAGGVILNTMKEELPEERESRLWAFALGAGGYAAVLMLV